MNIQCERIADQLASTFDGEAWYGDSLRKILTGVTASQALAHPISTGHSIWELLYHVEAWVKFTLGSLDGEPIPPWPAMPVELDWPTVTDTNESAWQQAGESFFKSHLRLVEGIKTSPDERLYAIVPGRTYNFYRLPKCHSTCSLSLWSNCIVKEDVLKPPSFRGRLARRPSPAVPL
jgi:hypothetical protein